MSGDQKYREMVEKFAENVSLICKCSHIPLGTTEKRVGMAVGWLSRVKREGKNVHLNQALALADIMGENIMDLCTKEYLYKAKEKRIQELEEELRRLKGEDEDATV